MSSQNLDKQNSFEKAKNPENIVNEIYYSAPLGDPIDKLIEWQQDIYDFADQKVEVEANIWKKCVEDLQADVERLRESAQNLVSLHYAEMEGLSSGQPTALDWRIAVNELEELLTKDQEDE